VPLKKALLPFLKKKKYQLNYLLPNRSIAQFQKGGKWFTKVFF